MPSQSLRRAALPVRGSSRGVIRRRKKPSSLPASLSSPCPAPCAAGFIIFSASQGVMTKAIAREMNMPIEALIGIGLM
jgi:ribosomal protein S8